jgi:hypothetical protein
MDAGPSGSVADQPADRGDLRQQRLRAGKQVARTEQRRIHRIERAMPHGGEHARRI